MPSGPSRKAATIASNGQGRRIDLDALRRARQDVTAKPILLVLGGVEFALPARMPAAVPIGLARCKAGDMGALEDVFVSLFGEERLTEVLRLGIEVEDLEAIMEEAYGQSTGESSASGG